MTVEIGYARTPEEIAACMEVRRQVFVIGQNVDPELDFDGKDDIAEHFMARLDGRVVGTARWIVTDGDVKMGRLAVLEDARGHGIGPKIFNFMVDVLEGDPALKKARLSSQLRPIPIYKRRGFVEVGERYMDAGMEHQDMERSFN